MSDNNLLLVLVKCSIHPEVVFHTRCKSAHGACRTATHELFTTRLMDALLWHSTMPPLILPNLHGPLEERVPVAQHNGTSDGWDALGTLPQARHRQKRASKRRIGMLTHRGAGRFWRLGPVSRCSSAKYPLSDVWLKSPLRRKNFAMTKSSSSRYSVLLLMSGTNLHHRNVLPELPENR
jgi:hypothetical protein